MCSWFPLIPCKEKKIIIYNNNNNNNKNKTNSIWNTQTLTNCLGSNVSRGMSEFIHQYITMADPDLQIRGGGGGGGGHPDPA